MRRHWLWPALSAVLGFGAFAGLGLLTRAVVASKGNRAAADTPEFGLWCALVGASVVLFVFLFAHSLHLATGWRKHVDVPAWQPLLVYGLLAGTLSAFQLRPGSPIGNLRPTTVLPVSRTLLVIGVIAATPAVLGLWLNHTRVRRISGGAAEPRRAVDVLEELVDCRRGNSTCLAVLAMIVTTSVVDAGAQRKAFLATGTRPTDFPAESVLLYGALFTAISLLLYVPTFVAWRSGCLRLVDEIYPLPADVRPTDEWLGGRTRLMQLLGAETTVAKNLTAAFGILAPLATSVLAVAVPGLK